MDFFINTETFPKSSYMQRNAFPKDWMHFSRTPGEYILLLIKSGTLYLKEDVTEYVLQENDILLLEPELNHVGYRPAEVDYYFIHMPANTFIPAYNILNPSSYFTLCNHKMYSNDPYSYELYENNKPLFPKQFHLNSAFSKFIFEKMDETILALANKDIYYKTLCSNNQLQILLYIANKYHTKITTINNSDIGRCNDEKLRNILTYLQKNFHEKITGNKIQKDLLMNFDYLNKVFKNNTGLTIFEYLQILRINKSKEYLKNTDLRIYEIAIKCGFSNEYHFNRVFTQKTGTTPGRFRKQ